MVFTTNAMVSGGRALPSVSEQTPRLLRWRGTFNKQGLERFETGGLFSIMSRVARSALRHLFSVLSSVHQLITG